MSYTFLYTSSALPNIAFEKGGEVGDVVEGTIVERKVELEITRIVLWV